MSASSLKQRRDPRERAAAAGLVHFLRGLVEREPSQVDGLRRVGLYRPGRERRDRVTHVVMEMGRLALAGGDRVDVEVKDLVRQESEVVQARFLRRLAQRGRPGVSLAVVVAAHLEPGTETAVVVQEDETRGRTDHEGASGDVAGGERAARETRRLRLDEAEDRFLVRGLARVGGNVAMERVEKSRACRIGWAGAVHKERP